jgi:nucleoside-diphosphate-sugar epimerase
MRLLVLGGTAFLGRATAAYAVAAGHEVTCAARGQAGPVPDGATLIAVDRGRPDGFAPLAGRTFDAVIDVSSVPSHVRLAVAELAGQVGHWTYVSTISVYADQSAPDQRVEDTLVVPPAPPEVDEPFADAYANYAVCKVACEEAVLGSGVAAFICRAGLIVGPEDPSDRFTYWPVRLARPGPVLAPGSPDQPVQWVDVRDLAAWLVQAAETGRTGVYDGTGAAVPWSEFLTGVAAGVGTDPEVVWVDDGFLADHDVRHWSGPRSLPLWLPLPESAGMLTRDTSAALGAGLRSRPLSATARDTLEWYAATGAPELRSGLAAAAEAVVLEAWHTSHQ